VSSTPETFMREAVDLAVAGVQAGHGGPFGAVVVRGDEVLGRGCNRVLADADPTAHAEVVAIRAACAQIGSHDLAGCVLYASCEPCPMCLGAALWSRVERIVFAGTRKDAAAAGFDDAVFYEELERPFAERQVPLEPLMRDEAQRAFEAWAARSDRQIY
jgi:guanine deaminase